MPDEVSLVPRTPFVWRTSGSGSATVVLQSQAADALTFAAHEGRLRVGLRPPTRRRSLDISVQPTLAWQLIDAAAAERDVNPQQLRHRLGRHLIDFGASQELWTPTDGHADGPGLSLGMSYPLVGNALDAGAQPIQEVPRWAAPVLSCTTARTATAAAFGNRATRRVVRALPMSLLPPDPADSHHVALFPLALALMGRDALDGDRLASVLEQPGLFRREDEWPDVDAVELGRQVLHRLDAGRVGRLLADAAVLSNGPVLLMDTLRLMHAARAHLPARLPQGLESLHELCVACTPVDPAPRVVTERTAPRWDEAEALATAEQLARQLFAATPVPGPPVLAPAAALRPPSTRGATANPHQVFRYAARIEQLNGNDLSNGLRLVLPRTGAELATWGQRLHNCLDDFIPAVTAGQSITIGVEQRGRLRYCLELTNGGVVRQFLGDRNRRVHTADAAPVIIALLTAGVLDRNADMNQPWMHIARGGLSATTDPWITGATRLFGSTQSPRARDTSPPSGAPDHHESRWTR